MREAPRGLWELGGVLEPDVELISRGVGGVGGVYRGQPRFGRRAGSERGAGLTQAREDRFKEAHEQCTGR